MPNKMLIDASHPEETRVVVTRGNRIEEFDFESRDKKQLKGNIYLARVTRVEPSLQAAFVEYGGNRHGFLAFNEIHPDYYQIPVADRQALLQVEAEEAAAEEEEEAEERSGSRRRRGRGRGRSSDRHAARSEDKGAEDQNGDDEASQVAESEDAGESPREMAADIPAETISEEAPSAEDHSNDAGADDHHENGSGEEGEVESVGAEDALEELPRPRRQTRRQYKIQEVIKRRQILLVQVVKEERGNKGAALTTYLSLAGRYSVLMPNTARGGGISRKITSAQDRKRLKDLVQDLEVPQGMGVILRTAGANRTKPEIKRDYEYLMRMWENVRTLTLQSTAPALVYEEGSLIKRSVRDLYNKDIEEILVAGDDGYREAKDFMRMLMPSHAKSVQPYKDVVPIFARNGIEAQLDRMLQPQVTLKSGGYIIINQTEALVSIDVNSGRSTREHSIEDTALQTNLEAAEEVARQLRLRDLAGLIVIDFIDMEENRNNRAVEKRMKDHLKNDRARIQVGRISHFGLLEMSRQRIRASVLESTMKPCPHCGGTGHVRSDSSVALHVVRAIEEFLLKDARNHITVRTPSATALYVLNHKRRNLSDLEERFGLTISIEADETLGTQHYAITRGAPVERPVAPPVIAAEYVAPPSDEDEEIEVTEAEDEEEETSARGERQADGDEEGGRRKRRRRRRRRGGKDREHGEPGEARAQAEDGSDADRTDDESEDEAADAVAGETAEEADGEPRKRRRGKRGGRRNRRDDASGDAETETEAVAVAADVSDEPVTGDDQPGLAEEAASTETLAEAAPAEEPAPARKPRRTRKKAEPAPVADDKSVGEVAAAEAPAVAEEIAVVTPDSEAPAPRASRRKATAGPAVAEPKVVSTVSSDAASEEKPKKGGWWQRKGFF